MKSEGYSIGGMDYGEDCGQAQETGILREKLRVTS